MGKTQGLWPADLDVSLPLPPTSSVPLVSHMTSLRPDCTPVNGAWGIGPAKTFCLVFSIWGLEWCSVVFNVIRNNFVRLYCDSCQIRVHSKNVSKLVNFCATIFILRREENTQHFQCIMLHYFKKGKNATEMQKKKKRSVQCMEKVLRLIKCVRSGLQSFLALLTFWPNNPLLWVCLTHWKMFSGNPGLYPQATCSKYPNQ